MDAMYVVLEYYSVWFCFTLHKFLHLTLSDHIMNAIRRINDVETNKLKLKHTIILFSPENFLLKRKFPPSSSSLARGYCLLGP